MIYYRHSIAIVDMYEYIYIFILWQLEWECHHLVYSLICCKTDALEEIYSIGEQITRYPSQSVTWNVAISFAGHFVPKCYCTQQSRFGRSRCPSCWPRRILVSLYLLCKNEWSYAQPPFFLLCVCVWSFVCRFHVYLRSQRHTAPYWLSCGMFILCVWIHHYKQGGRLSPRLQSMKSTLLLYTVQVGEKWKKIKVWLVWLHGQKKNEEWNIQKYRV